jgi:hypothetical protein
MARLCNCEGATELTALVQFDDTGRAWNVCDLTCMNCGGLAEKPEQEAARKRLQELIERESRI